MRALLIKMVSEEICVKLLEAGVADGHCMRARIEAMVVLDDFNGGAEWGQLFC